MLTRLNRKNIFKRDKGRCRVCGLRIEKLAEACMAHVVLRSRGGETTTNNLVTAHPECIRDRDPSTALRVLPIYVKIEDRGW